MNDEHTHGKWQMSWRGWVEPPNQVAIFGVWRAWDGGDQCLFQTTYGTDGSWEDYIPFPLAPGWKKVLKANSPEAQEMKQKAYDELIARLA